MSAENTRLKELQGVLREKVASQKAIADTFVIEGTTVKVSPEQKSAFDANMTDIKELKGLIQGLEAMDEVERWGSETQGSSIAAALAAGAPAGMYVGAKTLGQLFLESPEFKSLANGKNGANMTAPFELKTADVAGTYGRKDALDAYSAMPTGTPGSFGRIERDPMVLPPNRTKRVRDLFPARSTTAAVIEYFTQTGFTNNAAPVAERDGSNFALKVQSGLTFVGTQAPVRTIAHWEAAHRNVLADEPQLRSIIDNELLYGLRLQEDFQILQGDGTGENLSGILTNTSIQTYNWSDGSATPVPDTKGDSIRRAATLAFLAYYEPSGVVLHPNDWEDIELTKTTQGAYLMAVSMQLGAEARLWRLPVIDTPAMPEGTSLVGAFGTGAQLYDRESASIRISEQHSDFFVRNAIVVLAEQRLALAVKRPESFVKVSFDGAPAVV